MQLNKVESEPSAMCDAMDIISIGSVQTAHSRPPFVPGLQPRHFHQGQEPGGKHARKETVICFQAMWNKHPWVSVCQHPEHTLPLRHRDSNVLFCFMTPTTTKPYQGHDLDSPASAVSSLLAAGPQRMVSYFSQKNNTKDFVEHI